MTEAERSLPSVGRRSLTVSNTWMGIDPWREFDIFIFIIIVVDLP